MNFSSKDCSLVCPKCRSSLQTGGGEASLSCEACGVLCPIIQGQIPLLVTDPATFVAGERSLLEHDAAQYQAAGELYLQESETTAIRKKSLRDLASGLMHNGRLLDEFAGMLPPADCEASEYTRQLGADLFSSLRRDWGGSDEAEAELQVATQAVIEVLTDQPPAKTLVLGAGVGRTLTDLDAKFPAAIGIDLSFPMAVAYAQISKGLPIAAYHLLTGNFLKAEDECERFVAQRTLSTASPLYVVADATRLPFGADNFDAVVSQYFTDLIPLSQLLPEVKRVLKPGGRFIHFGPLGYAFSDQKEHYTVDQIPEAFRLHGFEVGPHSFIRNTYYANAGRLNRFDLDNLLFVACPVHRDSNDQRLSRDTR